MRPAAILYNRSNVRKERPVTLDETRFSHITVTPDEDDDVVIHAGTPATPCGGAPDAACGRDGSTASGEAARDSSVQRDSQGSDPSPGDAFRETTIEDLEPSPMPAMQKAVIAVAVVLFAIAVAYLVTH